MSQVSIVIPAYNEEGAVGETVQRVKETFEKTGHEFEVIVVDDGSSDATADEAEQAGAIVLRHPRNIGYGNAIMTGAERAQFDLIGLTDADGTYPVDELPSMVDEVQESQLDMLVGARQGRFYRGTLAKRMARFFFKCLAEFTTGTRIPDINSGLRVFRRSLVDRYQAVLCGGFSFTTTITVIAMLTHHFVAYRPISYFKRYGSSKVHYVRDTLRAGQILTMTILIFNPIKLYILLAMGALLAMLPAAVISPFAPLIAAPFALLGMGVVAACGMIAIGFLAEQHRASPNGVFSYQKGERNLRLFAKKDKQDEQDELSTLKKSA